MRQIVTDSEKDFFEVAGLGMQTTGVRQSNLRAILTLISLNPGLSAAELSRRNRLEPQTVALLIDDLSAAGLLRAGEVLRTLLPRTGQSIRLGISGVPVTEHSPLSACTSMSALLPKLIAPVGQVFTQAGSSPTATRSEHKVHL